MLNRNMNITEDLHYAAPLEDVLALFRSEELVFRRLQEVGHPDYEFEADTVDGKHRTTVSLAINSAQLPDQAATFLGKHITAQIIGVENVGDVGAHIDYTINTKLPMSFKARMLLVSSGATTAGKLEIHMDVNIPFAGSMIERSVASKIPRVIRQDTELVNTLLVERRAKESE